MNIESIKAMRQSTPMARPFRTALRTVREAESIIVRVRDQDGRIGWGEAPSTVVITGDSLESIQAAIEHTLAPPLIGQSLLGYERLLQTVHGAMVGSPSAKAALDMAIYDLVAQHCGLPLYQFLGGYKDRLETDFTVSVGEPEEMARDAEASVRGGFDVLKIKVGKDAAELDVRRIEEIRARVGPDVRIRLDANQGWSVKEAVRAIRRMEDLGLNLELVEQPVRAHDVEGLKAVTDAVQTPIMADESVFSPAEALRVLQLRAADLINIKLMKAGGIYKAQQINALAEQYGVECMVGSMIESRVAVTAAAHLAASKKNITRFDFDAPLLIGSDIVDGGVRYDGRVMTFPDAPGLGIRGVRIRPGAGAAVS
ncbi:dipeptide epimerase [Paenibacillus pasadenensis]|uniref:Dipeptide epimerase n=1 Tax=Paenibacillus pasadenensis TaxID=217090 RepID=A0A2N5NB06_9BACL|nr:MULTISPECIES: dipeptide epimerase [Paenibacillus]PLT47532.1 L-alanine-DL-glutamate epimerase [Paenibacillus pasadenensis]QGG57768.1 dipeptide epimerase [Paenibacillus sp. B01]